MTAPGTPVTGAEPWSAARAQAWYDRLPWLLGCNFVPSTAVNQLEMWQSATFDPATIVRELGMARGLGFNTVRVFLHDLLWVHDPDGLLERLDRFLDLASQHGLRTIVVFFDGCWNNYAHPGPQPAPVPGVHNSQWLQSPTSKAVVEPATWGPLRDYVQSVIEAHRDDPRVLMWDLYNEPGNEGKLGSAAPLTRAAFGWAREVGADQPLTSPVWNFAEEYHALNDLQLALSDVVTFHSYDDVPAVRDQIERLRVHGRPILCTEYLARTLGSRFQTHLPLFRELGVGALNWGLVSGRTQTIHPWFSPRGGPDPEVWFHDVLRPDGSPFDPAEVELIRRLAPTPAEV